MIRALFISKQSHHHWWERSSQCLGIPDKFPCPHLCKEHCSPAVRSQLWFMSLHLDTWFPKSCLWANGISITRGLVRNVREGVPPDRTEPVQFQKHLGADLTSPLRDSAACSNLRVIKDYDAELVLGLHSPISLYSPCSSR